MGKFQSYYISKNDTLLTIVLICQPHPLGGQWLGWGK